MGKILSAKKIREILRLSFEKKISHREIAISLSIGKTTVGDCLRRAKKINLTWLLTLELNDGKLQTALYPAYKNGNVASNTIDFAKVHNRLKLKAMTKNLIWLEYKEQNPDGISYGYFCDLYREWRKTLDIPMRQSHKFGEKLFIDYTGMTVPIVINNVTGEVKQAEIFVATLGGSNYMFVEATMTQSLPDWIGSHVRAFAFFNGVSEILVPDNLRSGVTAANLYEPDVNPTYQELASHYGVAVIPARVRKPRDKAKAEQSVKFIENRILARFHGRTFFNLHELNEAIKPLLDELNRQPFQKLPGSRLSQFEQHEKPLLKPLPTVPYEFAEWKKATVNIDYHIVLEKHYYSVSFKYIKKTVEIRYTATTIEVFHQGNRITSHRRVYNKPGRFTTVKEHMPEKHQKYAEWTPDRIINWARASGTFVALLVKRLMESRPHPQQGFKSCLGILRLGKKYGEERLNKACKRALGFNAINYKSVEAILSSNLDQQDSSKEIEDNHITQSKHDYVRGSEYFN